MRGESSPAARLGKHIEYQLRIQWQLQLYAILHCKVLRNPAGQIFFTLYMEHKTFGKVKFSSSGVQGPKTALGGADVFVSAAICSANMGCFASSVCELCGPSTDITPMASFLCCVGQPLNGPCASLGYCNCHGSAANRFAWTWLERKELDFHCLELGLISMGGFVYIFMLLCWQMKIRVTQQEV